MNINVASGNVLLRRYRINDIQNVYEAVRESISELSPWFAWCDENYTLEDAERFIRDQDEWWAEEKVYNFAITDQETGTYCGGCLLNNINLGDRLANMAYWVRSNWAGRGMATISAKLVAQYGFEKLGLNRVEIVVAQANLASIRVAEKTGAKREGELRRRISVRGKVYDAYMFSLITSDIKEVTES